MVNSYVHPPKPGWSTVSMIRNSTFAILKTLTLWGADAHTVAVTPDKTRLWVTSPPDNVIFIIDAETFEISSTKYLGDVIIYRPMGVAVTPDGNYAYVTLEETGEITVYNASTAAFVPTYQWAGCQTTLYLLLVETRRMWWTIKILRLWLFERRTIAYLQPFPFLGIPFRMQL